MDLASNQSRIARSVLTRHMLLAGVLLVALALVSCSSIQSSQLRLSLSEQRQLLELARAQLVASTTGDDLVSVDPSHVSRTLRQHGAAFVSLDIEGRLRGCMIDQFDSHEALYMNVIRNTQLAAQADERFGAVQDDEIDRIRIEITIVTDIRTLSFEGPEDLLGQLVQGKDGVILSVDEEIATYLPSVWEIFPDKNEFLSQLCLKAGWDTDRWKTQPYPMVEMYRVITIAEPE